MLTAGCIELFLELCQLIFGVGLFEWDDMIHGSIGAVLGMLLWKQVQKWMMKRKKIGVSE